MMWSNSSSVFRRCLIALLLVALPYPAMAYSVLTHEQLVDLAWKDLIEPVLLARFPGTTRDQLLRAHSYAYGGCAIQDLGYYPFGKPFFSDLTHYVRSGDFITNLLRDAQTVDEYAFALGALSHYMGDNIGHKDAINRAVALAFPKLAQKYGNSVSYGQGPHQHVRAEFAFDIGQLSKHRLAPAAYLEHVGLRVSRSLLDRAIAETYGLERDEVLGQARPAIRSYRAAVRTFLPRFAYAETSIHRDEFPPDTPNPAFQIYSDRLARAEFEKTWNPFRRRAGLKTHLVAFFVRIVPKIGAASDLAICIPTPETEDLYIHSVNRSVDAYRNFLQQLKAAPGGAFTLANRDLDTGDLTKPGVYPLTDKTYAKLLHQITRSHAHAAPVDLRDNILAYYADPAAPKNKRVQTDLDVLQRGDQRRQAKSYATSFPVPGPAAPAPAPSSVIPAAWDTPRTPAASRSLQTPDIR